MLIDSLIADDDANLSPAWKAKVTPRVSELDDGSVKSMSLDDFRNIVKAGVAS